MKKILGTLAAAALLAAPSAHATNGMRMIGFGPTQNAMGGASVAAPLDAAAVVSNPAGLSGLAPRLELAAQAFMPAVKYEADWAVPGPASGSAAQTSDRPTDLLPTLALVFRARDALTLGFAALGTAGMGVDYPRGPTGLFGGARSMTSYVNGRFAPAGAYRVNDQLSVGAAFNLAFARMSWDVGGQKMETASSLGYGATVGVTWRPLELLTLGASYESKTSFQEFEFTQGGQKMKLDFDQPQVATIGAAVRPVEGLLLAVDGQWINWSDTSGKSLPRFTSPPGAGGWNMSWSDQLVVKVGAEYQLPALKALKVRAGYNYGEAPLDADSALENVVFPAISEHHFTAGAGYEVGKVTVNLAVVYSPEATLAGSNPSQGLVAYESRMSQTAFELGGAYRF